MFEFDDEYERAAREADALLFRNRSRENDLPEAEPERVQRPQQQDWSAWDRWAEAHIKRALDAHEETLVDGAVSYVLEQTRPLLERISKLETEVTLLRAMQRGTVASIDKVRASVA